MGSSVGRRRLHRPHSVNTRTRLLHEHSRLVRGPTVRRRLGPLKRFSELDPYRPRPHEWERTTRSFRKEIRLWLPLGRFLLQCRLRQGFRNEEDRFKLADEVSQFGGLMLDGANDLSRINLKRLVQFKGLSLGDMHGARTIIWPELSSKLRNCAITTLQSYFMEGL